MGLLIFFFNIINQYGKLKMFFFEKCMFFKLVIINQYCLPNIILQRMCKTSEKLLFSLLGYFSTFYKWRTGF